VITENPAFDLSDQATRDPFAGAYAATSALDYRGQPSLDDILGRIQKYADRLREISAGLRQMDDAKAVGSDAKARHPNHGELDSRQLKMPTKGLEPHEQKSCRVSMRVWAEDGMKKCLFLNSIVRFSSPLLAPAFLRR